MIRRLLPLTLVGVLVACGGADDPAAEPAPATAAPSATDATTPPESSTAATPAPTDGSVDAAVPEALDFSAPLVGGGTIELGASAGRPVLLWFWAPW